MDVKEVVRQSDVRVGDNLVTVKVCRVLVTPEKGEPYLEVGICLEVGMSATFYMTVSEASEVTKMMSRLLPDAHKASVRQEVWEKRKREERRQYTPRKREKRKRGKR